MRRRNYVGIVRSSGSYEVFKSESDPTEETHGHLYTYVIGPFQTRRGADFMAKYGRGNPHLQHVSDAERLAKHDASNL